MAATGAVPAASPNITIRRPFFRRRKSSPFAHADAPKIDYKDVKLLQRFISERGKIVPRRITAVTAANSGSSPRRSSAPASWRALLLRLGLRRSETMQIILLERVPKLGQMGEVVSVRPGYARNFLIPTGKALRATKTAIADFEQRRTQLEARTRAQAGRAEMAARSTGRAWSSCARQARRASLRLGQRPRHRHQFAEAGLTLDRQQIRLEEPLKSLGLHTVKVALHPEVEVSVLVNVARSAEEANVQAGVTPPGDEEEEREPTLEEEPEALI